MAIIKITKADKAKGMPSEPGWYKARIVSADLKSNKDKTGTNIVIVYQLEKTEKEITTWTSVDSAGKIAPCVNACNNTINTEDEDVDLEKLVGKKLKINISNEEYKGAIQDKISGFLPYDAETADGF